MSNQEICNEINYINRKLGIYSEYIFTVDRAKRTYSSISNGLEYIKTKQVEKICENCIEALGQQEALLEKLELYHKNILDVYDNMHSEVSEASVAINNEIDRLERRKNYLYSQLD